MKSGFSRTSERGGVIVMLFVFVAMFAALTFAVTRSFNVGSGTTSVVSEEKMRLALTEINDIAEAHKIAIHTMLANKIPLAKITSVYQEGPIDYYPVNDDCGWVDMTCRIYAPEGGGLKWYKFTTLHPDLTDIPGEVDQYYVPNGTYFAPVSGKGSTQADLVYTVRVSKAFCNFINKTLGVTTADIDTTENVSAPSRLPMQAGYWNNFVAHNAAFTFSPQGGHLQGRNQGCYRDISVAMPAGGTGTAYFYYNFLKAF